MRFKLKANGKTYEVVPTGVRYSCHAAGLECAASGDDSDVSCTGVNPVKPGQHFDGRCIEGKWEDHIFVEVTDVPSDRS